LTLGAERLQAVDMACPHRAVLITMREVKGTSSNLASGRTELQCGEEAGHAGPHVDQKHDESWDDRGDLLTHILRQENTKKGE
jgi:hypothetical protein